MRNWGSFNPVGKGSYWDKDVAVDGFGNVYVSGDFYGTFDFDPGPGTDDHVSNGQSDAYLC